MPKNIPVAVRLKGMELYVANSMSAREIAEHLTVNYNVSVKPPTIYAWARKYDWDSQRDQVKVKSLEKAAETESERLFRLQQEHLNVFEDIRRKATTELNSLTFDRAFDAVKAAQIGVQGERQVLEGLINLQFVQDVIQILIDEVDDAEVMQRIAAKLRLLVANTSKEQEVSSVE